jgi:putative transposase
MIRVHKSNFITSKKHLDRLFECNRISAQVWNDCLEISKSYYRETNKWISKGDLFKKIKGKYPIHSQSIQAIAEKYLWARDAAREARNQGRTEIRYPYKQKKNFNTRWKKDGFKIHENGKIELYVGLLNGKRQPPIVVWIKDLPQGRVKEIELIYNKKLMLCLTYDNETEPEINYDVATTSIDLGEIHAISSVSENNEGVIITGRKLRSIKRFRNKKLAELQKKMRKCKKGSRQWKKYARAKRYVLSKSQAQLKDALHKIARKYVDWCKEQKIKHVVVGDVEGVQRNTKKKRKKSINQKLSQWQFGQLLKYLEYKLKTKGMTLKKVNEAYTSQTCPVCTRRKKPSGRVYKCKCGYEQHRDIHGACNILTHELYGVFQPMEIRRIKYLRIS